MGKGSASVIRRAIAAAGMLFMMASAAAKPPAEAAFDEWLAVFNGGDEAAMRAFNERRFGEAGFNIDYLLDSREETGGLAVVRVE